MEEVKKFLWKKHLVSFFTIPHLHLQTTRDPSEGQCHRHKKGEKGKFKYEKICVALKFMVDVVCMCLFLIRDGHMNPRTEYWVDIFHLRVKEKEGSGLRNLFFTFLSIFLERRKSSEIDPATPPLIAALTFYSFSWNHFPMNISVVYFY